MTKRLNLFLLCLLLAIGGPFYWLLMDSSPWNVPAQPLDIADLRALAEAQPGAKPSKVEMEVVGWRLLPGNLLTAGSGIKRRMKANIAFILAVPDQGPVMIETGMTAQQSAANNNDRYDAEAQRRVDAAMRSASLILATHEHPDHIGGLAGLAGSAEGLTVLTKARLNAWQVPQADSGGQLGWPKSMTIAPSLIGNQPQAAAPGVVVIPAPGHSPGSQMIYVRLNSGAEYLFAGDIASMAANWQEQRPRSRLVTDFIAREDRRASLAWLATVARLKKQAPALHVIASHDFEWLFDPENRSGVTQVLVMPPNKLAGT